MTEKQRVHISRLLSFVLRHKPETIGIQLDHEGWVPVTTLLAALQTHGSPVSMDELQEVVATNEKQRFAFSADGMCIRASQGHSITVDLGYQPVAPPEILYHGTGEKYIQQIRQEGLRKRSRRHVHLSPDHATALAVGQRHGKPVILEVLAGAMARNGYRFFLSDNGVWLTDAVPVEYLVFPEGA